VIGFQERAVKPVGKDYPWQEYLLHHPTEGFRWLVDSEGHWSWVSPVANPPRYQVARPAAVYRARSSAAFRRLGRDALCDRRIHLEGRRVGEEPGRPSTSSRRRAC
jgi:hypothetical protein